MDFQLAATKNGSRWVFHHFDGVNWPKQKSISISPACIQSSPKSARQVMIPDAIALLRYLFIFTRLRKQQTCNMFKVFLVSFEFYALLMV